MKVYIEVFPSAQKSAVAPHVNKNGRAKRAYGVVDTNAKHATVKLVKSAAGRTMRRINIPG